MSNLVQSNLVQFQYSSPRFKSKDFSFEASKPVRDVIGTLNSYANIDESSLEPPVDQTGDGQLIVNGKIWASTPQYIGECIGFIEFVWGSTLFAWCYIEPIAAATSNATRFSNEDEFNSMRQWYLCERSINLKETTFAELGEMNLADLEALFRFCEISESDAHRLHDLWSRHPARPPQVGGEAHREKLMITKEEDSAGSSFVSSGSKNFLGVGLMSHHPFYDPTQIAGCPRQVKLYDLFGIKGDCDSDCTPEEEELSRRLAECIVCYNDLSKVSETMVTKDNLERELTVQRNHLDPMRELFEGLVTTTSHVVDLNAIQCSFGVATRGTKPDGYVVDEQRMPRLIWEVKNGIDAPSESMRQGIPEATNMAMTQLRAGVPLDAIAVPVVSSNGYLLQIGVVIVLEPSFPMFAMLTPVLDLFEDKSRSRAARVLRNVFQFVSRPLQSTSMVRNATPGEEVMALSIDRYHLKPVKFFFKSTGNLQTSLLRYCRVLKVLHANPSCRDFVVFPYCVREYKTETNNTCLVFPKLEGYAVGLPKSTLYLQSYLRLLQEAIAAFHSIGVVHLDLFVTNIMWKPLGTEAVDLKIVGWDAAQFVWDSLSDHVSRMLRRREKLALAVMVEDNETWSSEKYLKYCDICLFRVLYRWSSYQDLQEGHQNRVLKDAHARFLGSNKMDVLVANSSSSSSSASATGYSNWVPPDLQANKTNSDQLTRDTCFAPADKDVGVATFKSERSCIDVEEKGVSSSKPANKDDSVTTIQRTSLQKNIDQSEPEADAV